MWGYQYSGRTGVNDFWSDVGQGINTGSDIIKAADSIFDRFYDDPENMVETTSWTDKDSGQDYGGSDFIGGSGKIEFGAGQTENKTNYLPWIILGGVVVIGGGYLLLKK